MERVNAPRTGSNVDGKRGDPHFVEKSIEDSAVPEGVKGQDLNESHHACPTIPPKQQGQQSHRLTLNPFQTFVFLAFCNGFDQMS